MSAAPVLADAYLEHHFRFRPVDATFMGASGHDDGLPPSGRDTPALERAGLARLRRLAEGLEEPQALGPRLDRRLVLSQIAVSEAALDRAPRFSNPAWWTGEAIFSLISLLLAPLGTMDQDAFGARLLAIPDFLSDGRTWLAGGPAPGLWVARARREARAAGRFLRSEIVRHPLYDAAWGTSAAAAGAAFDAFAEALETTEDGPFACGADHLSLLMREGHGLALDPDAAVKAAQSAVERLSGELEEMARRLDPSRSAQEQIASLSALHPPDADGALASYQGWNARALRDGAALVSPADEVALNFRWLDPAFVASAPALYFLSYRSPPGMAAVARSVYWVSPPAREPGGDLSAHADATVKIIHAVHHGSVGHHTQNRSARQAESRLARVGGTDCALGLAFLSAGSLVEGWACYVQDMMTEVPGFYTPGETLLLKHLERRNAASVLVDVRLHTEEWSAAEAMAFYRDKAGFHPARVEAEVTRNAMFPATRLMYWLGVDRIRALRARWRGDTRSFHDAMIGYGHIPAAWAGEEMARAGLLD